jgi:hypothetical protein
MILPHYHIASKFGVGGSSKKIKQQFYQVSTKG